MTLRASLLTAIILAQGSGVATAAPRIALVIGNSHYQMPDASLGSPENDAKAIAKAFCSVGFEIEQVIDGTQSAMNAAIERYQARLEATPGADAVVFYAGHGAQYRGQNYMLPVDMKKMTEEEFTKAAVGIEMIYDAFRYGKPRFALVIVDACRDSPFDGGNVKSGLAEPREADAIVPIGMPRGTITAFATDFNQTADDSAGGAHSPYTKALLQSLGEPGLALGDFFIRVRTAVENDTDGHQSPKENTGQKAPFLFRDPAFLRVSASADDDVMITAGGESYVRSIDGRSKQLRLLPGDNVVTAMVVNYRSLNSQGRREGWRYNVTLGGVGDDAAIELKADEDEPPLRRWGTTFIAARAIVNVHPLRGDITIVDQEPVVWEDGFSFIGAEPANRLYESIRWAIVYAGVPFFTELNRFPGEIRGVVAIAGDVRNAHRAALTHSGPSPHRETDAIAHRPHLRAIDMLDAADERSLSMVIERIRRETRPELIANLAGMFLDADIGTVIRGFAAEKKYFELRYFYGKQHASDVRARHLMGTVTNQELEEIVASLR